MPLSCTKPSDGQAGTYQSNYSPHCYGGYWPGSVPQNTYKVIFSFDDASVPPGVQARYVVTDESGAVVYTGPWHAPNAAKQMQEIDLWVLLAGKVGEYLVAPETTGYPGDIFPTVIRFLTSAQPGPVSHLWLPHSSNDLYQGKARGTARLEVPATPSWPVTSPPAARAFAPYSTVKGPAELWNTRRFNNEIKSAHRLKETLARVGAGSVVGTGLKPTLTAWADFQKYQSGSRRTIQAPLVDGPRAVAHRGWTFATRLWPGAAGEWSLDLEGRVWGSPYQTDVQTIAGWRNRADVYPPDWKMNDQTFGGPAYLYYPDWFFSHLETVGNFVNFVPASGVDPKPRGRLWYDLAVRWGATRDADEMYVCDLDRNAIVHVGPGPGSRTVRIAYANPDWTPGLINAPKSCDLNVAQTHLVVLNCPWYKGLTPAGASTLVRIDLATGGIEQGASIATLGDCDRVRHFSDDRLCVTSQSLGQVWEVDFATGPVRKIGNTPAVTRSAIAIDRLGECGPVDDVFIVQPLTALTRRLGRDGTTRSSWVTSEGPLVSGPMLQQPTPAYQDTIDVRAGVIVSHDEGSEHSYWITAKLPDDPVPDLAAWNAGIDVWKYVIATMPDTGSRCSLAHVYGQFGCGTLGGPYANGSWSALAQLTDPGIVAWGVAHGLTPTDAAKLVYPIRWEHPAGSTPPPSPDTQPPAVPTGLTVSSEWA